MYTIQHVRPCSACGWSGPPFIVSKVSTAGWVVFVLLLFVCLPFFWIGLLMRDKHAQCSNCGVMRAA